MATNIPSVSGTSNPYEYQNYTVESNDRNTLSITDYFQLLAAQLQNQDVTNPMDNSEMMAQMVQMGMMQAMNAMNDSMEANTATTTQTYAGSLLGQDVTVMVTEERGGIEVPTGVTYGKVEYVSFVNGTPLFKLEGNNKEYTMSYLVGVGKIPDPYAEKEEDPDKVEGGTDSSEGSGSTTEGTKDPDDKTEGAEGAAGSKEPTDAAAQTTGSEGAAETPGSSGEGMTEPAEEGTAAAGMSDQG